MRLIRRHVVAASLIGSALLATAPQAGRLLRPLCHALAVDLPACLRRPSRPRARPRAPRPAPAPQPPAPQPPAPQPPAPRFEPYVAAAARAWNPDFRRKRKRT